MTGPRLGMLLSGSGRTLQNLIDRIAAERLEASVVCAISDQRDAHGLERARTADIPAYHERDPQLIYDTLRRHRVDLVCLGGYLRLLPIADDFQGRILNIHPALLPAFGGKGFYGERVHQAVLDAGVTESGCTVHYCNDEYDKGDILVQRRVPVLPDDTVDSLAARVFEQECEAYPQAIAIWSQNNGAKRTN